MCSALTYSLPYHMLLSGFILSAMYYIPSVRMAILEIADSCEVVWKGELIFSVGRSVEWYRHCGICMVVCHKLNTEFPYDPTNAPGYILKGLYDL